MREATRKKKGKCRKTHVTSYGIISGTTLFNSPQLQRLRQEALVYSRITSHFCEIYLTPRVGEYPRAFVFENRYIFHGTFRSLIFKDYLILGPFFILLYLLILRVCEYISRYGRSLFRKN